MTPIAYGQGSLFRVKLLEAPSPVEDVAYREALFLFASICVMKCYEEPTTAIPDTNDTP